MAQENPISITLLFCCISSSSNFQLGLVNYLEEWNLIVVQDYLQQDMIASLYPLFINWLDK